VRRYCICRSHPGIFFFLLAVMPTCAYAQAVCPSAPPTSITFQVNSTADGLNPNACANKTGPCTLREAVQEADAVSGATIDIPAGTYTLTSAALNIDSATTLTGHGATIIQAGASQSTGIDRVFRIGGTGNVRMSMLTIRFGRISSLSYAPAEGGGGVDFDGSGNLCLNSVSIVNNTAPLPSSSQPYGGGLSDVGSGTVYLDQVTIANNVAGYSGGGIEAFGALNILNSTIQGNRAGGTGGGIDGGAGKPGTGGPIAIAGTNIASNIAQSGGGGICVWRDALDINQSTIVSNTVSLGGAGGGIAVEGGSGNATITNSRVDSNADGTSGSNNLNLGGGISFSTSGAVLLPGDDVSQNQLLAGAGGPSEADGGGIFEQNATSMSITNATITNNQANAATKSSGGGLDLSGCGSSQCGNITLDASTISGNSTNGRGGGIESAGISSLGLTLVKIIGNSAGVEGGGLLINSGSFQVNETQILANHAGTVTVPNYFQCGGGMLIDAPGTVTLSKISGNTAPNGGGVCACGNIVPNVGVCGIPTFLNDTISDNTATSSTFGVGGGIYSGAFTMIGSTVNGNVANQGAGIYTRGSGTLTNDTIAANKPGAGLEYVQFEFPQSLAVVVAFSTISGNAIGIWSGEPGGFIGASLLGTIVANNSRDCEFEAQIVLLGYDLLGSTSCGHGIYGQYPPGSGHWSYGGPGNTFNANPLLGPLQDNTGPTLTMAPATGSPAIGAVPTSICPPPATDQRGVSRQQTSGCDIGAVQVSRSSQAPSSSDFTISGPSTITLLNSNAERGIVPNTCSASVPFSATPQNGFSGSVSFSAVMSPGVQYIAALPFSPNPISIGPSSASTTLTAQFKPCPEIGTMLVTAKAGAISRSIKVNVKLASPGPTSPPPP
jgi:CSLREA domain-containing protein